MAAAHTTYLAYAVASGPGSGPSPLQFLGREHSESIMAAEFCAPAATRDGVSSGRSAQSAVACEDHHATPTAPVYRPTDRHALHGIVLGGPAPSSLCLHGTGGCESCRGGKITT